MKLLVLLIFLAYCGFHLEAQIVDLSKMNHENHHDNFLNKSLNKIRFKENKGQIKDQFGNPRPDILFQSEKNGLCLFLKKQGFHYQLSKVETWKKSESKRDLEETLIPDKIRTYRLDVQWIGSNPNPKVVSKEPFFDVDNFYNVANGLPPALNVKSYHSVKYEEIYPGIDVEFHGKNGYLEYDFIVKPGADYKKIQIRIDGAKIKTTQAGEVILETPLGEIREGCLKVFQEGALINSEWKLKGNLLSLNVPCYDVTKPLHIDPPIRVWGTYYGGTGNERIYGSVKIGDSLYFAGQTASTANIATTGTYDNTHNGGLDIMIIAFHTHGYRLWGTYAGGASDDAAEGMCIGENSNVIYVVGRTASSTGIATGGTFQASFNGGTDGFILKMNATNGTRTWGTYYGGSGTDYILACTYNSTTSSLNFVGYTNSSGLASSSGVYQTTKGAVYDCIFGSMNPSNGTRNWASYYGGTGDDYGLCITVDNSGAIYLGGYTSGSLGLGSILQLLFGGGTTDGIIAKFSSNGATRTWGSYYGAGGTDYVFGIQYNSHDGNVYFHGYTTSNSVNIATGGTHQSSLAGGEDAYLVSISTGGSRNWGTYYGGTLEERVTRNLVVENGYINFGGRTFSTAGIHTNDAYQNSYSGSGDAYWARFNASNGTLAYGSYYGGSANDFAVSIIVDNGEVFLSGYTASNTNIASSDGYNPVYNSLEDAFMVKFKPEEAVVSSLSTCKGGSLTFNVSGSATYNWYTTPTGGTPFHTGSTYNTPPLNETQVYYIEAIAHGCTSQKRTPVYAFVNNPVSNITSPSNHVRCYNASTTLSASTGSTIVVWREDFNDLERAQADWTINEYGRKYLPSSIPSAPPTYGNRWVINDDFSPYSSSPNGGNYLHITNTGNLQMITHMFRLSANLTAVMNYDIPGSFINNASASLYFERIGNGGSNTFIRVIYSVNGGAWQEYLVNFNGSSSWTASGFSLSSLTGWTPGASLRIGFRFHDSATTTSNNPSFGIDNIRIEVPATNTWYDGNTAIGTGTNLTTPSLTTDKNYGLVVNACGCDGDRNNYAIYVGYKPPTTTFSGTVCYNQSATIPVTTPKKTVISFDFAEGLGGWTLVDGQTLIGSSTPSNGTSPNRWVVNTNYHPLSGSTQGGNYLHIAPPLTASMEFLSQSSNYSNVAVRRTSSVTGLTASDYVLSFEWIGEGANDAYAKLVYSVNGGAWQEYSTEFKGSNTWQTFSINLSSLGWSPGNSFNFGFRWRNEGNNGSSSFGVDNIKLEIASHPYRWYAFPFGGTSFFTGDTYNTPPLTSNVTYYVEAGNTCVSPRTPITVNVNDPIAIVSSEWVVCNGGSTTINITGPGGAIFDWYTTPTGGTKFHTGDNYNTPPISSNTDYYIETILGGCTSSTRKKVTVYVNEGITPVASPSTYYVCTGNSANLNITFPTTTTINWYDAPSGGTFLGSGNPFNTGILTSTTSFYAESYVAGCPSNRTEVQVVVYDPLPPAPTLSGDTEACEGEFFTINATAPPGVQFDWYNVPSGGTKIHTGSFYSVSHPTAGTYNYYVESIVTGCTSSRTLHSITVNPIPPTPNAYVSLQGCTGDYSEITVTDPIGSYIYLVSSYYGSFTTSSTTISVLTDYFPITYEIYAIEGNCTSDVHLVDVYPSYLFPSVDASTSSACIGQTITYTLNNPFESGGITDWIVDANSTSYNIITSNSTTLEISFNEHGDYTILAFSYCGFDEKYVTIHPSPVPSSDDVTICEGSSANLVATGPGGASFQWYSTPSGGSPLATGSNYTTPILTSTTTYYLEAISSEGCISASRTPVTAFVNPSFTILGPAVSYQNAVEEFILSVSVDEANWSISPVTAGAVEGHETHGIVQFAPNFSGTATITVVDEDNACSASWNVTINPTVKVKLKALLQGAKHPSTPGTMEFHSDNFDNLEFVYLSDGDISMSPYPFLDILYGNAGSLHNTVQILYDVGGHHAIDVVQVELRDALNPATILATAYGWLLDNGEIIDYSCGNGEIGGRVPYLNFRNVSTSHYHIVVKHRNHLPIRTATSKPLNKSVPTTTVDLTNPSNIYNPYGNFVHIQSGYAYMLMGNVYDDVPNGDIGEVNASDFFVVSTENDMNLEGYYLSDLNMDGVVNADDFNLIQIGNQNLHYTDIPLPYLDTTL